MSRIRISGKTYELADMTKVSLRDVMLFDLQAEPFRFTWADAEALAGLTKDELDKLPRREQAFMTGVMVWVARRVAGEDVTFDDAVNIPLDAIDFLPDTEDRKPAGKATRKPRAKSSASAPVELEAELDAQTTQAT